MFSKKTTKLTMETTINNHNSCNWSYLLLLCHMCSRWACTKIKMLYISDNQSLDKRGSDMRGSTVCTCICTWYIYMYMYMYMCNCACTCTYTRICAIVHVHVHTLYTQCSSPSKRLLLSFKVTSLILLTAKIVIRL